MNVTHDDHPPRATRSRSVRAILQDTAPQSEEGGSSSGSGEELGSESDAHREASRIMVREAVQSLKVVLRKILPHLPQLIVVPEADTVSQTEAGATEDVDEVTPDNTMVHFVYLREFDPVVRHQLIDYFRSMWMVNRSEDFFKNGIVSKLGGFRKIPLMLETRVVMADIQAFPYIYILFQIQQF
ncbi:hypothetical protein KY290_017230 [Solanum tuberosum]|uniref:Uncharacterized protein n=1 Tax=Solanum tuberosum TaxID=4113 RepID=A0ABQ7VAR6_SOLTU|nr:hypothetical protein KY284_016257 [Solanum tuberosum]KAH0701988.1 hypothetical protein KY285_016266 [Solanum tuberosum]KAH0761157.1 hypothetical protein KY290_017230 [Solanum tuberosum]